MAVVEDREVAVAILKAAQEGGYLDSFPDENEVLEMANAFAEHADKEFRLNPRMRRDKTVKEILFIVNNMNSSNYNPVNNNSELSDGLPIPGDIDREPSSMPFDLTECGDREIRKLHAEFNAYLNRARWLLATTTAKLADATHLREHALRNAIVKSYEDLTADGKRISKELVDTFARGDEEYLKYEEDVKILQNKLTKYKALVDIYGGNVDRLSREWTMRQNEWERGK